MAFPHTRKVLQLYRQLLRLHQRIPDDAMATIGRQFVREEFHKHRSAGSEFVIQFVKEWTDYAELLERQLAGSDGSRDAVLGRGISPAELDMMSEQQLRQLLELKTETSKPRVEGSKTSLTTVR